MFCFVTVLGKIHPAEWIGVYWSGSTVGSNIYWTGLLTITPEVHRFPESVKQEQHQVNTRTHTHTRTRTVVLRSFSHAPSTSICNFSLKQKKHQRLYSRFKISYGAFFLFFLTSVLWNTSVGSISCTVWKNRNGHMSISLTNIKEVFFHWLFIIIIWFNGLVW